MLGEHKEQEMVSQDTIELVPEDFLFSSQSGVCALPWT